MDTKKFFKFIYAIYNGYHRNINAMCDGKLDIEEWGRVLAYKRKGFEACVFSCYIENKRFVDGVRLYYNKFKKTLANYEKSNWFDSDYDINQDRRKYFEQQYHIIRRKEITLACEYLEPLLNRPSDKELDDLFHYNLGYTKEQFKSIYDFLINGKYLESTSTFEDFVYYFSGNGNKPQHGLEWKDKKVNLALFIEVLCRDEDKRWLKAEQIFGVKGLRQSHGNTAYRKDDNNPFEDFVNILKDKRNNK